MNATTSITQLDDLILGKTYRLQATRWMDSPVFEFEGVYMGRNVMTNTASFELTEMQTMVFVADALDTELANGTITTLEL